MSATLTLGLFSGKKTQAYDFMRRWYELVYSENSANGVSAVGVLTKDRQDVAGAFAINGDIKVELMSPDNATAFSITMTDCWPQTVRLVDIDSESGDQMAMLEYTLVVNDWFYNDEV
jgi:hypothetical protein